MSKDILDVLSDPAKVKKIAVLPTAQEVEEFFENKEKIKVDTKDIKVLGNVFQEALSNGAEAIDEKKLASVGGGFSFKKAAIAAGVIGAAVGGGYLADRYLNEGKGMDVLKAGADKTKEQVNAWFNPPNRPNKLGVSPETSFEKPGPDLNDREMQMDFK